LADDNCNACDGNGHLCKGCNGGFFLDEDSDCITGMACAMAGKVPLGAYGGKCVTPGYACDTNCDVPTSLGDGCEAFAVTVNGQLECTGCDSKFNWNVDGKCTKHRVCHKRVFRDNGDRCTCRAVGAQNNCGTCNVFKATSLNAAIIPSKDNRFIECTSCKKRRVLAAGGSCITVPEANCPANKVLYIGEASGSMCEEPFACDSQVRTFGTKVGEACLCLERDVCKNCMWGLDGHKCTMCKKKTVNFHGKCVPQSDCIAAGGVPIMGEGPKGGICRV
jgi:hypothetical protein